VRIKAAVFPEVPSASDNTMSGHHNEWALRLSTATHRGWIIKSYEKI